MFWWIVGFLFICFAMWAIVLFIRALAREMAKEKEREARGKNRVRRDTSPHVSITSGNYNDDEEEGEEKETIQKGNSVIGVYDDYVVVDVETTGGSPKKDAMIEVAAVRVENGEVVKKYNTLINPERTISSRITKINGITDDMVLSAPNIDKVIPQLLEFMSDSIVVAHNANFDINFISSAAHDVTGDWFTNDFVDTLKLSRAIFSEHKNHKLEDLIKRFGIDDAVEHRALPDTIQVQKCYEHIKDYARKNNLNMDNIDGLKRHGRKSATGATGATLFTNTELSNDESKLINQLLVALKDINIQIKTNRDSKSAVVISYFLSGERYDIQLGKIKFGAKSNWMSGYGIGNDSPAQRLNGGLVEFTEKIDEWAEAIKRHNATGIDIFKQEEDLTK